MAARFIFPAHCIHFHRLFHNITNHIFFKWGNNMDGHKRPTRYRMISNTLCGIFRERRKSFGIANEI